MNKGTEHPNVDRFRALYEAFSKGDAETVGEALADDLVWHVPGRHRFSGDRSKADTMALFDEVVPEFSETGKSVIRRVRRARAAFGVGFKGAVRNG